MKKITRKRVTKEDFESIKLLQEAHLNISQTMKVTGRSYNTVKKVYDADTHEEYLAKPVKIVVAPPTLPERPVEDTELIITKLNQIATCLNTLLEVIKDKEAKANASFWRR